MTVSECHLRSTAQFTNPHAVTAAAVTAWGLVNCAVDRKWHSDTVTAIRVPENIDANNVIKTAYHKYGVSLGAGLGPLNGNVFRIGHLGWPTKVTNAENISVKWSESST